eukprot:scaffold244981_cov18-Prasinocladus_malaysianus.AAC.1
MQTRRSLPTAFLVYTSGHAACLVRDVIVAIVERQGSSTFGLLLHCSLTVAFGFIGLTSTRTRAAYTDTG